MSPPLFREEEVVVRGAVERGWVTPPEVEVAGAEAAAGMGSVLAALLARGTLADQQVVDILTTEFDLPAAPDLADFRPLPETLALIPRPLAVAGPMLPLERDGRILRLAVADPSAYEIFDGLAHRLNLAVEPMVAPIGDLTAAIVRLYDLEESDRAGVPEPAVVGAGGLPGETMAARPPRPMGPSLASYTPFWRRLSSGARPTSTSSPWRGASGCATGSTGCWSRRRVLPCTCGGP